MWIKTLQNNQHSILRTYTFTNIWLSPLELEVKKSLQKSIRAGARVMRKKIAESKKRLFVVKKFLKTCIGKGAT